jgi:hypothetical protein
LLILAVLHHSTTATFFAVLAKKVLTLRTIPPSGRKVDIAVETWAWLLHFFDLPMLAVQPTVPHVSNKSVVLAHEDSSKRVRRAGMLSNILDPTRLEGCSLRVETLISSSLFIVLELPFLPPWTLAGFTSLIATVATVRAH